jgi:hypothetical protein
MMKRKTFLCVSLLAVASCAREESTASRRAPLQAACTATTAEVPAGGWVCGESRTVECNAAQTEVDFIYVSPPDAVCDGKEFSVSDEGPFAVGTYDITVSGPPPAEGADPQTCVSTLVVKDSSAPTVEAHTSYLWPPNHKYHTINIADCVTVTDACDPNVHVTFTYAASDEPVNDTGDGNTEGDISNLNCDSVELRSERKGNSDSRYYTLGFRATDAAGNTTDGKCHVVVNHDQGGKEPIESAEAYRVDAPEGCAAPPPSPPPPPPPPPAPTPRLWTPPVTQQ